MKSTQIIKGIAIVLVLTSFIFYQRSGNAEEELGDSARELQRMQTLLSDYQVIQLYDWMMSFDSLNNVTITDQEKEQVALYDLLKGKKAVFIVENGMCERCISKELKNLNLIADVLGRDNLVLLAKNYSYRYLYNSDEFSSWRDRLYQTSSDIFHLNNNLSGTPLTIILNKDLSIQSTYHALKSTNQNFEFFHSALQQTSTTE